MFRKILLPATVRLSRVRPLTTLTRQARPAAVFRQDLRSSLLSNLKISPLASFLHTQTPAPTAVAELQQTVEEDVIEKIQPARFDSVDIQPATLKAIQKVFKYNDMSTVQEAVLKKLPNDKDMFVKAKTGTGKTLAFLTAALETSVKDMENLRHFEGTSILVISPTRELANQIADEAEKLTAFYPFKVHCMVGGDSKRRQVTKLERSRADIVVATPGRLNDMLSSVPRFKKMCENLKVLVLDEADQLLDMGFKQELQRILNQLPTKRQTMLYSATISPEIRENLGKFALSPEYDLIDTVGKNEVNTHLHVKQSAMIAPYTEQFSLMREVLDTNEAAQKGKVIVFLPTTKATMVYAEVFKRLLPNRTIYEIHSKKGQDQRSRIANRFRNSNGGILFTSDVSARGVDYPGVSLVVQVGVPSSREQYIHRLGRTGRAGREGEGLIFLAPFEKEFLTNEVADLPVQTMETPEVGHDDKVEIQQSITKTLNMMDEETVREVYTAYLGYYSGRMGMLNQRRSVAVTQANGFLEGLVQFPSF
ncbi:DEAD-domain-containing protein [Backusella circina FSU 941]|nr:DEAD-domain-containing protein [Backusella circina FSU 941]